MIDVVTQSDFIRAFEALRPENFSRPALAALFEDIERLEEDTGEQYQLDVIGLCCEWAEYSLKELAEQFPDYVDPEADNPIEELSDWTLVLPVEHWGDKPDTYLVREF